MSIPIRCNQCGHEYHVNPSLAGKRVKCRQCHRPISIPAAGAGVTATPAAQASTAAPAAASNSTTLPDRSKPHHSPMRHVYRVVAILVFGMFGVAVYLIGQNMGLWGEPPRPNVAGIQKRAMKPAEQLEFNRHTSQDQLEMIGQALNLYAKANRGNYPPRLLDVYEVADLAERMTVSPFGGNGKTDYAYLYFRSMGTGMHPQTLVAYDAAALARDQGAAVLYASGKTAWLTREQLQQQIDLSEQRRLGLVATEPEPEHPPDRKNKLARRQQQ